MPSFSTLPHRVTVFTLEILLLAGILLFIPGVFGYAATGSAPLDLLREGQHFSSVAGQEPSPEKRDELWDQAAETFKRSLELAAELHPGKPGTRPVPVEQIWYAWGQMLEARSHLEPDPAKQQEYTDRAEDKYQQAVLHNPLMQEALTSWRTLLVQRAIKKRMPPEKRHESWERANDKFLIIYLLSPENVPVLAEWGQLIMAHAESDDAGDRRDMLLEAAEKTFRKAHSLAPRNPELLYDLSRTMAERARLKGPVERKKMLTDAKKLLRDAMAIKPAPQYSAKIVQIEDALRELE